MLPKEKETAEMGCGPAIELLRNPEEEKKQEEKVDEMTE